MILDICVSSACNLGCLYCSEGKATFDKSRVLNSKIKVSLQEILNFTDEFDVEMIGFWGGEPFLNFELCKQIMSERPHLKYMFYTNGMYIDRYLNDLLYIKDKVKDLYVQVSYDGKAINDRLRLTKSMKSVSEQVRNAMLTLKKHGVHTNFKSTVTADTFKYMFESFKDIIQCTDSYFPTPDCFSKYDDSKWNEYYSDLKSNLIQIAHYIYDNKLKLSSFKWFTDSRAICQCGDGYISLDVDGYIFPCHSAMYSNLDHKITHIRDINLKEKLEQSQKRYKDLNSKVNCVDCDVRYCMRCPIGSYQINKGTYEQRYTTKNIDMCKVFKISDQVYKALLSIKSKEG